MMITDSPTEAAPVGSILRHSEKIHQKLQKSGGLIADLRELAAKDDNGTIKYLAPLEHAFQSLQELYEALSDYAIFLQRTGRRMSQASTNRALSEGDKLSPLEPSVMSMDEFFDAEEIVLTEVSDDFDDDPMISSLEEINEAISDFSEVLDDDQLLALKTVSSTLLSPTGQLLTEGINTFRLRMPQVAPPCNISLSSILRRSIGKDWSSIPMPVALNEPLSALQRLCEELEYSHLLDEAANHSSPLERMTLVAAFAVSAYASSVHRVERKPFNPLLGETFEYERPEKGYRFIAEKVCHRPLTIACHAESSRWSFWQDQRMKNRFWGKSMEYIPSGNVHVVFSDTGDHFIWSKVITCVRNLLSSNKWVENYGDMIMRNDRTGDTAKITFKSNNSGFFGASNAAISNEVVATIMPSRKGPEAHLDPITLRGRWDSMLCKEQIGASPEVIWKAFAVPNDHMEYFGFGEFAITLNDLPGWLEPHLLHSDSRLRPDQRLVEQGKLDEAETIKQLLEQRQREQRQKMEEAGDKWEPQWFYLASPTKDDPDGAWIVKDPALYWDCRKKREWPPCPRLW